MPVDVHSNRRGRNLFAGPGKNKRAQCLKGHRKPSLSSSRKGIEPGELRKRPEES